MILNVPEFRVIQNFANSTHFNQKGWVFFPSRWDRWDTLCPLQVWAKLEHLDVFDDGQVEWGRCKYNVKAACARLLMPGGHGMVRPGGWVICASSLMFVSSLMLTISLPQMRQICSVRERFEVESAEASNCVLMLSFPPPPPSEVAEALSFANRTVIECYWCVCPGMWYGSLSSHGNG